MKNNIDRELKIYAIRLKPGDDLRQELELFAKANDIQAGFIITAVGSLQCAFLRLAAQSAGSNFKGKFEIVSLTGILAHNGAHLHAAIADENGKTVGGHLMLGCQVYTTAEIVIGEAMELRFGREIDEATGYRELVITSRDCTRSYGC